MPADAHTRLLDLIADVCGLLDLDDFRRGLIAALHRAIRSDYVSINDAGANGEIVVMMEPRVAPEHVERFTELAHDNPLLTRYLRTRDARPYRFSDVIPEAELHELALFKEVYGPIGAHHQMAFVLTSASERLLAVALSRRHPDYSDAERDLAAQARPFLVQAYRNALEVERLRTGESIVGSDGLIVQAVRSQGVTAREAEALRLVALGRSNAQIGEELSISARTVAKHLERAFRKLGVSDRAQAAERVWSVAAGRPRVDFEMQA